MLTYQIHCGHGNSPNNTTRKEKLQTKITYDPVTIVFMMTTMELLLLYGKLTIDITSKMADTAKLTV